MVYLYRIGNCFKKKRFLLSAEGSYWNWTSSVYYMKTLIILLSSPMLTDKEKIFLRALQYMYVREIYFLSYKMGEHEQHTCHVQFKFDLYICLTCNLRLDCCMHNIYTNVFLWDASTTLISCLLFRSFWLLHLHFSFFHFSPLQMLSATDETFPMKESWHILSH